MKKAISILLVLTMIIPTALFGANAAGKCDCGITPVIYVVGFGKELYLNPDTDEQETVYPPSAASLTGAISPLLKAVAAIAADDSDSFAENAMIAADSILEKLACDNNGNPIYNVSILADDFEDNHKIAHYLEAENSDIPSGNFTFAQDWRLSPIENAVKLKEYTEKVKEITGHNEVSFIAHSQGNTIVASYLKLYGNNGIKKITFLSPAFQGLSLMGGLFTKDVAVSDKGDALIAFMDSFIGKEFYGQLITSAVAALKKAGIVDPLLSKVQNILDEQFDVIFSQCLMKLFGTMPGVWAFIPDEYYEEAKAASFTDSTEYTVLINKIDDYHYNVQNNVVDIISNAKNNGTDIAIACGYDISTIPVTGLKPAQSDMLIDTKYMSLGATEAPFGEKLGKDYKQAVNCGHNHLSADGILDASTAAFPENTWFIKGLSHNEFPEGYLKFIDLTMLYDGQLTVSSEADYPQFLTLESDAKLVPVQEEKPSAVNSFFDTLIAMIKNFFKLLSELIRSFK